MKAYLKAAAVTIVTMIVLNTLIKRAPNAISGPISKALEGF